VEEPDNRKEMKIKAIIFDLVGVLLDFRGPEKVLELSEGRIGAANFAKFWGESEWALRFSQGTCSSSEFAKGAVTYFEPGPVRLLCFRGNRGGICSKEVGLKLESPHLRKSSGCGIKK
jgi:hypothetical protein